MTPTCALAAVRLLTGALALLLASACGLIGAAPVATSSPAPSPTLLPPPKPISSPDASPPAPSDSPRAAASPAAEPTRIPPPNLNVSPSGSGGGERVRVANTEGQGANMRAEPSPTGPLVRTVREGTELELIGPEREGGGRRWRNVRDPASGASGWIVSELLAPVAAAAPQPTAEAKPAGAASPPAAPGPLGEPKPAAEPAPSPSPAAPSDALPSRRLGDADRAYLAVLQEQVDALGKGINAANEQIERAGGRPEIVSDPGWRAETEAVIGSLRGAAAKIRAATPGSATGEVHRFARNAADRATEAADGLAAVLESRQARGLSGVRTTLVRLLAEINNMNLSLLDLQSRTP